MNLFSIYNYLGPKNVDYQTLSNIISFSEFQSLNTQIDQLNSVLDVLEKKNDDIQAKLMELLVSSRELRATQSMSSKEAQAS